jgi:hypothetical protein
MRVAHIITRLILGGAQENTLLTCEDLIRAYGDDVLLVTGPPLGPEGSLLERANAKGTPTVVVDALRRAIHPGRDAASYYALRRELRRYRPDVVPAFWVARPLGRCMCRRSFTRSTAPRSIRISGQPRASSIRPASVGQPAAAMRS